MHEVNLERLRQWLDPLDTSPLECDGLSRAISALMKRDGVRHKLKAGGLRVAGAGEIGLHFWVELDNGYVCDYRARMWLGEGEAVPHGVFLPTEKHRYIADGELNSGNLSPSLFNILTGLDFEQYPRLCDLSPRAMVQCVWEP